MPVLAANLLKRNTPLDFGNYKRTVFLAGTGRSGTTWISQVINYKNEYRYIFEPFHSEQVDLVRHFRYRQYLRPDNSDERFLEPVSAILSGKVNGAWVDKFNRKNLATRRLVKDIRANHLLRWIKTHFPEIPVILLLRHPCAVANSKIKLHWNTHLDAFLSQPDLVDDHLRPFRDCIERAASAFEKHVFLWCIENYVPLKQFRPGEIHVALYEEFCTRPEVAVGKLFAFLKKSYDPDVLKMMRIPSKLSREDSAVHSGERLIETWQQHVTPEQTRAAVEILKSFGLDGIYGADPVPRASGEQCFLS